MKDIFSLKDKVVIVTGGTGYLGSSMVNNLLEYGAQVAVVDKAEKRPNEIVANPENFDRVLLALYDLSSTESIKEMFEYIYSKWGRIDVLINCAAYGGGSGGAKSTQKETVSDDVWELGIEGTLSVTYKCIREVLPYMKLSKEGSIVNIASMYGVVSPDPEIYGDTGFNSPPMYGAGKAGVLQLTRYYAANLAQYGIRVNSITPGPFPGQQTKKDEDFIRKLNSKTMLKRVGMPEELAGAVILLASGSSSFMTGSNITVDGGWTAW